MRRSLVLAGGGVRVAWQTGVVRALYEAGLDFHHVDGTSGGILTTAMLLSGQSPAEMGMRWSTLDVSGFSSPLPPVDYLRGPWALPALGDADGILGKVFPHLGVDIETIRASPIDGTFNVVDFVTKTCHAIPHTDVDAPLLAAGMSLPLLTAPLKRSGRVWTDAVWVKDANLTEALRRGADEIWLIWCIGNSPYWGDGPLEQYVHMIEMSANGALFAELDAAAAAGRSYRLHVVKPHHPLPLDPQFFAGRISADTLVAMGYRDATDYLDIRTADGLPHDTTCTRMVEPTEGVRFRERLQGDIAGSRFVLDVTVELPLPEDGSRSAARLVGHVDYEPWGGRVLLAHGVLEGSPSEVTYTADAYVAGEWRTIRASRELIDDPGFDAWTDATTVNLSAGPDCTGRLRLSVAEAAHLLASVEPFGVHGLHDRGRVLASLGKATIRRLLTT